MVVVAGIDVAGEAVGGVGVVAVDNSGVDFEHDRARASKRHSAFGAVEVLVIAGASVGIAVVYADVARLGCGDARHCDGQEGRSAKDPVTHRI